MQALGHRAGGTKGPNSGPQQGAEFTKGSCAPLPSSWPTVQKEIITWQNTVESQVRLPEVIGKGRYHLDKTRGLDPCCPSPLNQSEQKAESNQLELWPVPKLCSHHHTLSCLSAPFPQKGS